MVYILCRVQGCGCVWLWKMVIAGVRLLRPVVRGKGRGKGGSVVPCLSVCLPVSFRGGVHLMHSLKCIPCKPLLLLPLFLEWAKRRLHWWWQTTGRDGEFELKRYAVLRVCVLVTNI